MFYSASNLLKSSLFSSTLKRADVARRISSRPRTILSSTRGRQYVCDVDAEDPHGYSTGLYYPVLLGDAHKDGQYKVIHKLGWGAYATVWLARDTLNDRNVALKIARTNNAAQELRIMQHLRNSALAHPGRPFVVQLLDSFDLDDSHKCIVLEPTGMTLADLAEEYVGGRVPAKLARNLAMQIVLGLDYLWDSGVAHGDLHTGNILLSAPAVGSLPETHLLSHLRVPETGAIRRMDGNPSLESRMPRYLVRPVTIMGCAPEIRIADFGSAFFHESPPDALHTPPHMRAPEALFGQPLSHFAGMWSLGCLLFEIFTGRPFISPICADRFSAMREIQFHIGNPPAGWKERLNDDIREKISMGPTKQVDVCTYLRLAYDQDDAPLVDVGDDEDEFAVEEYEKAEREFTEAELEILGRTICRLLVYDPGSRGDPGALLKGAWFGRDDGGDL